MFSKFAAIVRGLIYLCAPLSLIALGLSYGIVMAGKTAGLFARDYLKYFVTGEWFDDLRLRVFWPLKDFYFTSVSPRLVGVLGIFVLPFFILANLVEGFRDNGGFQGFVVELVDDLRDIRNAIVSAKIV